MIPVSKPRNSRAGVISSHAKELTIVMPCLNEAETLEVCIRKAKRFLAESGIAGEVLVADNGSTDGSQAIAQRMGARLVPVAARGYGAALLGGIEAAQSEFIIMADADDSYDLEHLLPFVEKLREGYELVMGNRFRGGIRPGAMRPLHRYLGNPVLSGLGRLFFKSPIGDFHCGIRGFLKTAVRRLDLHTTGMEFASEMVVKATLFKLKITEVPTTLFPDGRSRPPHLRSWRDGWRHLRFLLLYSPKWLFYYPGMTLLLGCGAAFLILLRGPVMIGRTMLDIHSLLYAGVGMLAGFQILVFYSFSHVYAVNAGFFPETKRVSQFTGWFTLEKGILIGLALTSAGLAGAGYAFFLWGRQDFGPLNPARMMRLTIPALTSLALGIQVVFSSFVLSMLSIRHR